MNRILVLCYEYPPLGGGGGRVAAQVAEALAERGYEVSLITGGMPHLPKRTIIRGVEVIRVCSRRKKEEMCTVFEMMLWVLAALPVVLREVWKREPKVLHAHFAVPTGALAWIVHQLVRIPYVLTVHLGDVPGGVPEQTDHLFKWVKPLTIPIWRAAAAITAVSSFVAALAEKAYEISPKIILNGIKLSEPHLIKSPSSVPQLLMVGRLSIQKNPLLALQALALLRELPWHLKIIGEGPLGAALRAEVLFLKLEERVTFLGWLAAEEVKVAMQQSDILLMPSLSEGLPMTAVEALSQGLAIIGSNIGGLQDVVIDEKNGRLFDLKKGQESMSSVLRPFLENHELLEKAQAASLAHAKAFEWNHSIDAYEEVLRNSLHPFRGKDRV